MHYGGYDASKNGQPTIHVIDRSNNQTNEPLLYPAPENKQISETDFAQVLNPTNALRHKGIIIQLNRMYPCGSRKTSNKRPARKSRVKTMEAQKQVATPEPPTTLCTTTSTTSVPTTGTELVTITTEPFTGAATEASATEETNARSGTTIFPERYSMLSTTSSVEPGIILMHEIIRFCYLSILQQNCGLIAEVELIERRAFISK